jgi:hypothetical protein
MVTNMVTVRVRDVYRLYACSNVRRLQQLALSTASHLHRAARTHLARDLSLCELVVRA